MRRREQLQQEIMQSPARGGSNRRRQCIAREPMTSEEEGVTSAGDHAITSKGEAATEEDNAISGGSR